MQVSDFVDLVNSEHPDVAMTIEDVRQWQEYGWLGDLLSESDVPSALRLYRLVHPVEPAPPKEKKRTDWQRLDDLLEVARLKMRLRAEQDAELRGMALPRIRQDIFGDPEVPFPDDLKVAREWIEAEARDQWDECLGELEYVHEDGRARGVSVFKGTRLARLWDHANGVNKMLFRWRQKEVVRWILTGSWEPPSPFDWSWAPGVEYTITVKSPDVPIEFVKRLAKELREAAFGRKRAEKRKEGLQDSVKRAMALVEFVERERRFQHLLRSNDRWWDWRQKWNRLYRKRGWAFEDQDAMRMAYNRAKKRIPK